MLNSKIRFIGILGILLVAGFILTSITSYMAAHKTVSEQISESTLPLTSNNIYSEIQRDLLQPIFISSLMANDTFVRDWSLAGEQVQDRMIKYLREIQDQYNTVTSFFVSQYTKRYYHPKGVLKTLSREDKQDAWYYAFIASHKEYEINLDFDTASPDKITVFINHRVMDYQGNLIGVTGVGLSLDTVRAYIADYEKRYGRHVSFVDRNGKIMMSSKTKDTAAFIRDRDGMDKITTRLLASPSGTYRYETNGRTYHVNARLIDEFQWYLLVEQEEDLIETHITQNLISNLIVSFLICAIVIILIYLTLSKYQGALEKMATTDNLTGVSNRHIFEAIFDQTVRNARRNNQPVSLAMVDIDHFKKVNDTYGHGAGDAALKDLVALMNARLRDSDTICRWGGEEFILLLPECSLIQAFDICDNIRANVESHVLIYGKEQIKFTASFGVSEVKPDEDGQVTIKRADDALYRSKRDGRNMVTGI